MGPNEGENFKTILLLHIAAKSFQTFTEFSSQRSSQNYVGDVWNFEFPIYTIVFQKNSYSPLYPMEKPKTSII